METGDGNITDISEVFSSASSEVNFTEIKKRKKKSKKKKDKKPKSEFLEPQPSTSKIPDIPVQNDNTNNKNDQNDHREDEHDSNDENDNTTRKERIPPLLINKKDNEGITWSQIRSVQDKLNIKFRDAKINKSGDHKITPENSSDHRTISSEFQKAGIKYHIYQLQEDKVIKAVLRGIDVAETSDDIKDELIYPKYPVINVFRMFNTRDGVKKPMPLVMVELKNCDKGKEIFNLTHLLSLRITVESLRRKAGPGQCHRCQRFGHAANLPPYPPLCSLW